MRCDLALIHPPSVFDFRREVTFPGPISEVVPSAYVFDMYPYGFLTLASWLESRGFRVGLFNLAAKMLLDREFDPVDLLSRVEADVFGIDLHWMVHAHGALEVARIVKELHPDSLVVLGGLSATYYWREVMEGHPYVDAVLRGDSTEEPLRQLLAHLRGDGPELAEIPNLCWRREGEVVVNPLRYVPGELGDFSNNYRHVVRSALRGRPSELTPIHDWWEYPITAIMTCRGCVHNCIFCGGSNYALRRYANRTRPAFRDPHRLVEDIRSAAELSGGPIFVVGDLRQAGMEYARTVLRGLRDLRLENQVVLELFDAADPRYLEEVAEAIPRFNLQISPESHDEEVRRICGKPYDNRGLERTLRAAMEAGCGKLDVFFIIGLPRQDRASVMRTVEYAAELMDRFGPRLFPFISPLAPFLDPGSRGYEEAERYGYRVRWRTLEEYRRALLLPSWKHTLSYETAWLSREEIVEVTYEAARVLNEHKLRAGLISPEEARRVAERIDRSVRLLAEVDRAWQRGREPDLRLEDVMLSALCEEREIRWPLRRRFRPLRILRLLWR